MIGMQTHGVWWVADIEQESIQPEWTVDSAPPVNELVKGSFPSRRSVCSFVSRGGGKKY